MSEDVFLVFKKEEISIIMVFLFLCILIILLTNYKSRFIMFIYLKSMRRTWLYISYFERVIVWWKIIMRLYNYYLSSALLKVEPANSR